MIRSAMKKFFIVSFVFALFASVYADDKYTTTFSSRTDATFQFTYFAHKNSQMDALIVNKDASMTFGLTDNKANTKEFTLGVYTFDTDGNIVSNQTFDMLSGQTFTVNFTAGQMVGFWADLGMGKIDSLVDYTHKDILNTGKSFWSSTSTTGENKNSLTLHFADSAVSRFGVAMQINGGSSFTATGQPLPGVLATAIFASVGIAGLRLRKKRR